MASENGVEPRKAFRGLGSLEGQLMETLWSSPIQLSVQEVCDRLGPEHNYKTVMTVLNRLVEKDLLKRDLDGRAYKYRPRLTRDDFLAEAAGDLVQGYVGTYGPESARHLSSAVRSLAPTPAVISEPPPAPAFSRYASISMEGWERRLVPVGVLLAAAVGLQLFLLIRGR